MDETSLERLPPRALALFRIHGAIRGAIWSSLPAFGAVWLGLAGEPALAAAAAAAALAVLAASVLVLPSLSFRAFGFAIREHDVIVEGGVLFRRTVAIPSGRVQHVDVYQGPLQKGLGLAGLRLFTASGQGADGDIPALLPEDAARLRDRLTRREGGSGL